MISRDCPDIPELPMDLAPLELEETVISDIRARRALGRAKYGKTMDRDDLSLRDWLEHHYQELLDAALYAKRAIRKIDQQASQVTESDHMLLDPELEKYVKQGGSLEC